MVAILPSIVRCLTERRPACLLNGLLCHSLLAQVLGRVCILEIAAGKLVSDGSHAESSRV